MVLWFGVCQVAVLECVVVRLFKYFETVAEIVEVLKMQKLKNCEQL